VLSLVEVSLSRRDLSHTLEVFHFVDVMTGSVFLSFLSYKLDQKFLVVCSVEKESSSFLLEVKLLPLRFHK